MQKIVATGRLFATIFSLAMLWVVCALVILLFQPIDNKHLDYIPKDAYFVLRIETQKVITKGISSLIVHEDEKTVELLRKLSQKESRTKIESTGISANSDFILFKHENNGSKYTGILLNINDPISFKKNIPLLINNQISVVTNGSVGLLYFESRNNSTIDRNQLKKRATKILKQKTNFDINLLGKSQQMTVAQLWSNRELFSDKTHKKETTLSLILKDKELIIDGSIHSILQEKKQTSQVLKPKGVHLRSNSINDILNDTLSSFFKSLKVNLPQIKEASLNYFGLEIIDLAPFFIAPKFDAAITFEDTLDLNSAIERLCDLDGITKTTDRSISYRGLRLYYRQLNEHSIILGVNQNPELINKNSDIPVSFSGKTEDLTRISGSSMMKRALLLIPEYKAFHSFMKEANFIDFYIQAPQNGISKIHGRLEFKQKEHGINSLARLLLQSI